MYQTRIALHLIALLILKKDYNVILSRLGMLKIYGISGSDNIHPIKKGEVFCVPHVLKVIGLIEMGFVFLDWKHNRAKPVFNKMGNSD